MIWQGEHCPNCEAAKQELHDLRRRVSDMASAYIKHAYTVQEKHLTGYKVTVAFEEHDAAIAWFDQLLFLPEFIIPKPDPIMAVCKAIGVGHNNTGEIADQMRSALDMLGFEIREKNNG